LSYIYVNNFVITSSKIVVICGISLPKQERELLLRGLVKRGSWMSSYLSYRSDIKLIQYNNNLYIFTNIVFLCIKYENNCQCKAAHHKLDNIMTFLFYNHLILPFKIINVLPSVCVMRVCVCLCECEHRKNNQ